MEFTQHESDIHDVAIRGTHLLAHLLRTRNTVGLGAVRHGRVIVQTG